MSEEEKPRRPELAETADDPDAPRKEAAPEAASADATSAPPGDDASAPPGDRGPANAPAPKPEAPVPAAPTRADDEAPRATPDAPAPAPPSPPTGGEVLLTADRLCKYYGRFTAIEDVSFEVRRGQVVAFLGPNGAGKSTTMRILAGVIAPDSGEAKVAGFSSSRERLQVAKRLGYLPENGPLYLDMTPEALLRFFGEARGLSPDRVEARVAHVTEQLELGSVLGKAIHKLSRGFRQRVGLAQALLHDPDVLVMDEPTTGLDPNQIRDVRRMIRALGRDKAVLLSTHILQEVEAMADRVVFIHEGRIVFQGTVADLRASTKGDLDEAFASHTGERAA